MLGKLVRYQRPLKSKWLPSLLQPGSALIWSGWFKRVARSLWMNHQQILLSYIGSFLGIAVLAYLTIHSGYPIIAAPFGATAVLVFALPDSPLAQPRNVIGGNCIAAITCVTLVQLFGSEPWVMALAVATSIKLMQLTRTLHPPGGAIALLGVSSQASWSFIWAPILLGSLVLVCCTIIFNKLISRRPYPTNWL